MDWLLKRRIQMVATKPESYIEFADSDLGAFSAEHFGDGTGTTERYAKRVLPETYLALMNGTQASYTSFDEFQYFMRVTSSGKWKNNTAITSIALPRSCREISGEAFNGCTALESINLGNVKFLRYTAFKGCSSLSIIVDMPNLIGYGQNHRGLEYETFANSGITKMLNLGSVTDIGQYAFCQGCTSLTEVWLPATLTSIGRQSFNNCTSLATVVVLAKVPPSLPAGGQKAFYNNAEGRKIYVPYSSDHSILNAYKTATGWDTYATDIYELTENGNIPE